MASKMKVKKKNSLDHTHQFWFYFNSSKKNPGHGLSQLPTKSFQIINEIILPLDLLHAGQEVGAWYELLLVKWTEEGKQ